VALTREIEEPLPRRCQGGGCADVIAGLGKRAGGASSGAESPATGIGRRVRMYIAVPRGFAGIGVCRRNRWTRRRWNNALETALSKLSFQRPPHPTLWPDRDGLRGSSFRRWVARRDEHTASFGDPVDFRA
jgi:hypothetical protein